MLFIAAFDHSGSVKYHIVMEYYVVDEELHFTVTASVITNTDINLLQWTIVTESQAHLQSQSQQRESSMYDFTTEISMFRWSMNISFWALIDHPTCLPLNIGTVLIAYMAHSIINVAAILL